MACIQKIKCSNTNHYRAIIKNKDVKTITKVFKTRKLAVEFAKRIEGNRELLLAYGSSHYHKISFKELIDKYLRNEYKGSDPKGQQHKLNFWIEKVGDKNIEDITKSEISIVLQEFPSRYSNATVNRYKAAISVVFSYACRNYNLADNPVRHIPSRPENNKRIRFLSNSERMKLFNSCKQSRWNKLYLLALMAITTGALKGITSLVLLNENTYQAKEIRKSLIRHGFIVRPASSIHRVTRKSDAVNVSYNKAEEQYGIRVTSLPSSNNPCMTNSGAVHFTEVEFELINLVTNRTIMFVAKGGRNESCPGSIVGGTTTLFNDLAKELAAAVQ